MSQIHGANVIAWREWSEESFAAAKSEDKPVLLTLGATWCHWCHVMDETSYSDARVIELVNSRFIPVRVDVDQRPDISLRYNPGRFPVGGLPDRAVASSWPAGPITPPDEMAALLEQVSSGEFVDESARPTSRAAASSGTGANVTEATDNATVDAVMGRLTDLYDAEFGGFGLEPKQPPWEAIPVSHRPLRPSPATGRFWAWSKPRSRECGTASTTGRTRDSSGTR